VYVFDSVAEDIARAVAAKASKLRLGLYVYDALAFGRNVGRDAAVSAEEMQRAVPGFDHPTAGLKYFECRTDDARLTLEVARTARSFGAWVANHAAVESLDGPEPRHGRGGDGRAVRRAVRCSGPGRGERGGRVGGPRAGHGLAEPPAPPSEQGCAPGCSHPAPFERTPP